MITNLIEPRMMELILDHLIENNSTELRSGVLDSYFSNWFYEVIVQNFVSGQSLSKVSWLSNITKIPVAFKTRALNTIRRICYP